jgi:hypothetical protein
MKVMSATCGTVAFETSDKAVPIGARRSQAGGRSLARGEVRGARAHRGLSVGQGFRGGRGRLRRVSCTSVLR